MTTQALAMAFTTRVRRLDRVLLTSAGLIALLAVVVPTQALATMVFTARSLAFIAPFLILSVLVAASAKAAGIDRQIATVFSGHATRAIVIAAVFGAFSPFCSCGVIPIIAGLLGAGVPLAPVMAFWISSPLMDPEMFILMLAQFELPFVLAKTMAALLMGVAAGFIVHLLVRQGVFANPLNPLVRSCESSCRRPALENEADVRWAFWRYSERRETFVAGARTTGWFLLTWLTLAFIIESLMLAYLPADTISASLGNQHWWAIPASAVVGVPAYLNGYAAIPMVSALIDMGMAPGAALTFMVAGGVTSIPAAMAVFALVKRPVFALYLVLGLTGSMLVGFAYQAVITL
ncbi:MAG: permease [Acidiferrobacterales bacterium]